jgi:alpha-tubulin suppressor-like RCC1 family protein
LEVGEDHTCGLSEAAFCWGLNLSGQLGDGSEIVERARPVEVIGGLAFRRLSLGISHTCGITAGGGDYCWGRNSEGQLGDGTLIERNQPVEVSGDLEFAVLSAGGLHSCALTPDGAAYCWGSGAQGQLGNNSSGVGVRLDVPTPVSGGLAFDSLDAGGLHTCGVASGGAVYCWGSDGSGALGTAADETCDDGLGNVFPCSPTPTAVTSALAFASVSAGVAHTCAVARDGAAYCWGRNVDGQLGDGSTSTSPVPVAVIGDLQFVAVSAGNFHSCGLTASGAAYCWGGNHRGQLGDGSVSGRASPTLVSGGLDFISVSAGGAHTCGLTQAGAVYCWGTNADGALGVETTSEVCIDVPCSLTPVRVRR